MRLTVIDNFTTDQSKNFCLQCRVCFINISHGHRCTNGWAKAARSNLAIEICAYAVMPNHYHVVLHINREQGESWNTREVLEQWTKLFTQHLLVQRFFASNTMSEAEIQRTEKFSKNYRRRLLDVSWFMRCLNENLVREANKEDRCKRRFWSGDL